MIAAGQYERASELLSSLPAELNDDAAIQLVSKKIAQYEEARKIGDPVALERDLAQNPDDHEARVKLAKVLNAQGRRDEAADHLLYVMRKDAPSTMTARAAELLEFFEAWGFKDPATVAAAGSFRRYCFRKTDVSRTWRLCRSPGSSEQGA